MGKNALFIALLLLFDGVAVIWAAWEFRKLRPQNEDPGDGDSIFVPPQVDAPSSPLPSPEAPRHPKGQHGADNRRA